MSAAIFVVNIVGWKGERKGEKELKWGEWSGECCCLLDGGNGCGVVGIGSCLARRGVEGARLCSKGVREGAEFLGKQWRGGKFEHEFGRIRV